MAEALQILNNDNFFEILVEWYYDLYSTFINEELVPQLWSSFASKMLPPRPTQANQSTLDTQAHNILFSAFNQLYLLSNNWINNEVLKLLFDLNQSRQKFIELQTKMKSLLRSILSAETPVYFNQYLLKTYSLAFSVNQFQKNKTIWNDSIEMTEVEAKCKGCQQKNQCLCDSIIENFLKFNRQLSELSLIEVLSSDAITSVMHSCIEKHIYNSCKGIKHAF